MGYEFDLRTNELRVLEEDNPTAAQAHTFTAYRASGNEEPPVVLAEGERPRR